MMSSEGPVAAATAGSTARTDADRDAASELIARVGSLVSKQGQISLSRLASAYDKHYGSFRKEGYGKLKDFILNHPNTFELDVAPKFEGDFVVRYLLKSKKGKRKNTRKKKAAAGYELQPGDAATGSDLSSGELQSSPSARPRMLAIRRRSRSYSGNSSEDCAEMTGNGLRRCEAVATVSSEGMAGTECPTDQISTLAYGVSSEILEAVTADLPQQIDGLQTTAEGVSADVRRLAECVRTLPENVVGGLLVALQKRLESQPKAVSHIREQAAKDVPRWGQWKQIEHECNGFSNGSDLQLLLVLGSAPRDVLNHISVLRQVRWCAVFDTDPDSEVQGLYQLFQNAGGMQQLTEMWVPANIVRTKSSELTEKVDCHKMPWLFVNGRRDECPELQPKEYKEWKAKWLSAIGHFLKVIGEKLDQQSPVCCFVLPFEGKQNQFITTLLQRLDEELTSREMVAKYLVVSPHERVQADLSQLLEDSSNRVLHYCMPPMILALGLTTVLEISTSSMYMMPTGPLPDRQYLYIKEYLTPLYRGCEREDLGRSEEAMIEDELEAKIKEHQQAFLSGQPISFLSLKYHHDAPRCIAKKLQVNLQQLMDRQPVQPSTVVEVIHPPGGGGTTIARRALWDLSGHYPCAVVHRNTRRIQSSDEEDVFVAKVSQRISDLEDLCGKAPLILLDGDSSVFRRQSLARRISDRLGGLGRKAVIMHCLRANEFSRPSPYSEKVGTELTLQEKHSFQEKYRHLLVVPKCSPASLSRTFHFPLWAFLEDFKPKLRDIVCECIKSLTPLEVKVIRFVALMQKYGGRSVPPLLLYQMYLKELSPEASTIPRRHALLQMNQSGQRSTPTYADIHNMLSENAHVLLVESNRKEGTVTYDLQHILVAEYVLEMVLQGQRRRSRSPELPFLADYIEELLDLEALKSLDNSSVVLFEDLFLFNKNGDHSLSFSVLLETLRHQPAAGPPDTSGSRPGNILVKAADVFQNAKFYSQAARFYTYEYADRPMFDLAHRLIGRAFDVCKACESRHSLWDTKGLICRIQLQRKIEKGDVASTHELEGMADKALRAYNNAITSPPSWPNPLIGKVQVWLACIDWILSNECSSDVSELITYLATRAPPFFRSCLSESFFMIDMVERLIVTQSVQDVEHTRKLANECKIQLCFLKSKKRGTRKTGDSLEMLIELCDSICSNPRLGTGGKKELLRLQVYFWLSKATRQDCDSTLKLDWFPRGDPKYLVKLLLRLVETERDVDFTPILLRVATYLPQEHTLPVEKGIQLASVWQSKNKIDPLPYFFCVMFYFVQIVEGRVVDYGAKYLRALERCRQLSSAYINTYVSSYYLGKGGGLSGLVDKRRLVMQTKDDPQLNEFWRQTSRQQLRELKGRIKVRKHQKKRPKAYIELIQGQLEIFVGKNQELGDPGRDFQEDQLASFVLLFDLTSVGRDRGVYIPLNSRLFLQDDIDYFGYFIYQYKLDLFI